jgi:hypothetical protein
VRKELGKISKARWGAGGYQDACIGLTLEFSMKGSSVGEFLGGWMIERSDHCKWTEADRLQEIGKAGMKVAEILEAIHGNDVNDIVGTPVEVTFDGNRLHSWRLLTEVL